MASTTVSSSLGLEVLNRNNYKRWRLGLRTYLLAEDLWKVVEAETQPAKLEDGEAEYNSWRKKDAKALYAIRTSCGPDFFHFIDEAETARSAWDALERANSILTGNGENSYEYFKPYVQFTEFVEKGDWDKAKECLKLKGLDLHSAVRAIDPRDEYRNTAIHVAAMRGHVHIVKELMLLMTHEDLKMENAKGSTALHLAAANGQLQTVKELVLLMGEKRDNNGDTALHRAVHWGKVDIVKELVSFMRQTDLKIKNNNGDTALHLAVKKQNVQMVKIFKGLVGEVRGPDGETILHMAVKMGAARIVQELVLLMRGEDLAIRNDQGYTALQSAVKMGNVPIVKKFLTKEKERDFEDSCIQFTDYVKKGQWDNAKECLTELDDPCDAITIVDPRDGCGNTALHAAARQGHAHIVRELISLLKVRQDDLELKTVEDFTAFGRDVNLDINEEVVMKKAEYMVEQYEKSVTGILEVQNTGGFTTLHIAIQIGNIDIVKELLSEMRQESLEFKTFVKGYSALHLAVLSGNMNIVKEVIPFMRKKALEEKDGAGYTALGRALLATEDEYVMEIAKCMDENNPKVFGIGLPPSYWLPVVWSLNNSRWDLCRSLYSLTPFEYLMPEHGRDGAWLIIQCLRAKKLDMALDILRRCSKLAIAVTSVLGGSSPIMELACMPSAFLSGTQLGFWQHFIYNRLHVEPANLSTLHTCINVPNQENNRDNQFDLIRSGKTLYKKLVCCLFALLGVNQIREIKWIHTHSIDILCCMSEMLKKEDPTPAQLDIVRTSMCKAVEYGNVDFVTHICEAHPSLASSCVEDKNVFQFAVECRQHEIYSLIYGISEEDQKSPNLHGTTYPENILHLAGKLSPLSSFNRIRGAALQMQRELQWFKAVEDIILPEMREVANSNGLTPHELFTKNHETLKKEAEDSMKGTATSCTVVGALIVTIMFAAAFTVPGGNNGNTGAPMFLAKKLFMVFIISDTLSLVSSTTSVILFLGILTSRYAEDDFLKNLPTKMMIGLSTLFISIVTMMIAFSSALIIMLKEEYSWAVIPSICAAGIPVISYIWLQFPLLIEIFWSTYGPGIFDKKLKKGTPWIAL